jgi:hypothetical protein
MYGHRNENRLGAYASRLLKLLRTSERTHYDMLREKLKWGNG